jgi:hypothetical protein
MIRGMNVAHVKGVPRWPSSAYVFSKSRSGLAYEATFLFCRFLRNGLRTYSWVTVKPDCRTALDQVLS